jgi:hypothetical protein
LLFSFLPDSVRVEARKRTGGRLGNREREEKKEKKEKKDDEGEDEVDCKILFYKT